VFRSNWPLISVWDNVDALVSWNVIIVQAFIALAGVSVETAWKCPPLRNAAAAKHPLKFGQKFSEAGIIGSTNAEREREREREREFSPRIH
jgi:hypothetical protein